MAQKRKVSLLLFLLAVVLGVLAVESARAGGWAVVTLEELPGDVMAGRPFTLHFAVRQHGLHLLGGLSPTVTAVQPDRGEVVTAEAVETNETGVYAVTLTLPAAGTWGWSIEAFRATHPMPPLTVMALPGQTAPLPATAGSLPMILGWVALLAASVLAFARKWQRRRIWLGGSAAALLIALVAFGWQWQRPPVIVAEGGTTPAVAPEQMGEALFVAKGCIQCHQNRNVTMAHNPHAIGPNLTNYEAGPEFLRLWLADPPLLKPGTQMPDLGLKDAEIETLIAFLNWDAD